VNGQRSKRELASLTFIQETFKKEWDEGVRNLTVVDLPRAFRYRYKWWQVYVKVTRSYALATTVVFLFHLSGFQGNTLLIL
jgi:hypothetical protein